MSNPYLPLYREALERIAKKGCETRRRTSPGRDCPINNPCPTCIARATLETAEAIKASVGSHTPATPEGG